MMIAALLGGSIPAGSVYFGGSRPSEDLERRVQRIEAEQMSRTNRLAAIEAMGEQNRQRLDRIEAKIDKLANGAK